MSFRNQTVLSVKQPEVFDKLGDQKISEIFGMNTFSVKEMEFTLSKSTFKAYLKWMNGGEVISNQQADEISETMKTWAISKGVGYFTHWFQPMTGLTAEKHDSFIDIKGPGSVIEKFSGTQLIQGEPDASSFPNGGIRTTFEARGYTAWDPSSPAFIMESKIGKTLCIPTIFVSYTGEALDKKLPLLRADAAINKAATELLTVLGREGITKVISTLGAEQEYFLIDTKFANLRPDILLTDRTVLGADSPKGQQLDDQYFGAINDRVLDFMSEVGIEGYKLGIPITTRHNEVAPSQYEFAPIYESSNIAADHNQLLMDVMKRVAAKHGFKCLLHEKPFANINGSGKHVNWSLSDNLGNNLLNPGDNPENNIIFLTVLASVVRAVYKHADLLRATVANTGNEFRLGANEAPPAIISMFLGDQLFEIAETLAAGGKQKKSKKSKFDFGVGNLPNLNKDTTDRNRTSPFAFTGQKFEFRAVGSSQNISTPAMVINAIVAESMNDIVADIKKLSKGKNAEAAALKVIQGVFKDSMPILFNGNNYSDEWVVEAKKRGLPNVPSTPEALKAFLKKDKIKMLEKLKILSKNEILARYNIWTEAYSTIIDIEARTLIEMVNSSVLPAAYKYENLIASNLNLIKDIEDDLVADKDALAEQKRHLSDIIQNIYYTRKSVAELEGILDAVEDVQEEKHATYFHEKVKPVMEHIRKHADILEKISADSDWVLPKYREMLFIK